MKKRWQVIARDLNENMFWDRGLTYWTRRGAKIRCDRMNHYRMLSGLQETYIVRRVR